MKRLILLLCFLPGLSWSAPSLKQVKEVMGKIAAERNPDISYVLLERPKFRILLGKFCGGKFNPSQKVKQNIDFYLKHLPALFERFDTVMKELALDKYSAEKFYPLSIHLSVDASESCQFLKVRSSGGIYMTTALDQTRLDYSLMMFPHEIGHVLELKIFGNTHDFFSETVADVFWRFFHQGEGMSIPEADGEDYKASIQRALKKKGPLSPMHHMFYESTDQIISPGHIRDFELVQNQADYYKFAFNPYFISCYTNGKFLGAENEVDPKLKNFLRIFFSSRTDFHRSSLSRPGGWELETLPLELASQIHLRTEALVDKDAHKLFIDLPASFRPLPATIEVWTSGGEFVANYPYLNDGTHAARIVRDDKDLGRFAEVKTGLEKFDLRPISSEETLVFKIVVMDQEGQIFEAQKSMPLPNAGLFHFEANPIDYRSF